MKYILVFTVLVLSQLFFTGCSKHVIIVPDTTGTDSGNTDGGNTDGGNTDGGNTDGGNTDGGNTDGGNTDGGNTDGGNTDGSGTDDTDKEDRTDDSNTDGNTPVTVPTTIYEDGSNLANWAPSETHSGHIGVLSESDGFIKIRTTGKSARHILYKDSSKSNWNNTTEFTAIWDLKTDARYEVMFLVQTKNSGDVYVVYSNAAPVASGYHVDANSGTWKKDGTNAPVNWGKYSYNTIENSADGTLRTQVKDLLTDLRRVPAFANEEIMSVKYALVINWDKGKDVYIDNIKLKAIN